jgi:hypothetical protein
MAVAKEETQRQIASARLNPPARKLPDMHRAPQGKRDMSRTHKTYLFSYPTRIRELVGSLAWKARMGDHFAFSMNPSHRTSVTSMRKFLFADIALLLW